MPQLQWTATLARTLFSMSRCPSSSRLAHTDAASAAAEEPCLGCQWVLGWAQQLGAAQTMPR
eukprot:5361548-Alexandrium_andersonii.AAC.1